MELRPPFVYNHDGDLRIYATLKKLAAAFEAQDIEDAVNKIGFDSAGAKLLLTTDLTPEVKQMGMVYDFVYPVKIVSLREHDPKLLRSQLIDSVQRSLQFLDEDPVTELDQCSVNELIAIMESNNIQMGQMWWASAKARMSQERMFAVILVLQAICVVLASAIMDFGVILKTYLAEVIVFDGLLFLALRRSKLRLDWGTALTMPVILFVGAMVIGTYKSTR